MKLISHTSFTVHLKAWASYVRIVINVLKQTYCCRRVERTAPGVRLRCARAAHLCTFTKVNKWRPLNTCVDSFFHNQSNRDSTIYHSSSLHFSVLVTTTTSVRCQSEDQRLSHSWVGRYAAVHPNYCVVRPKVSCNKKLKKHVIVMLTFSKWS